VLALPRRGVARRHDPEDARQQLVRTATEERDTPRSREPKGRAGGSGPALPADPNRTPARAIGRPAKGSVTGQRILGQTPAAGRRIGGGRRRVGSD